MDGTGQLLRAGFRGVRITFAGRDRRGEETQTAQRYRQNQAPQAGNRSIQMQRQTHHDTRLGPIVRFHHNRQVIRCRKRGRLSVAQDCVMMWLLCYDTNQRSSKTACNARCRAAENSSPGFQSGNSEQSARYRPARSNNCTSSTAPARSQSSRYLSLT